MSRDGLTDEELRQAAAEAGISPQELRVALAERQGGALESVGATAPSVLGPPARGVSTRHVEGRIGLPTAEALAAVRGAIERQTRKTGHKQGADEVDIVDDDARVTYRLRATDDGGGGALVRVDVDATAGRGFIALAGAGMGGATVLAVGLAWLFGSFVLWLGALGLGAATGLVLARLALALRRAVHGSTAVAAQALMEVEDVERERPALPASR